MDSYDLQWRYMENFVKYIHWAKEQSLADYRVCIVGKSPFARPSGVLQLKQARLMLVAYENKLPDESEISLCHLAYLSKGLEHDLYFFILNELKKWPVLTVSDREQFIQQGGLMQFITVDNKLRFIINGHEAKRKGIIISPALLRLSEKGAG
ncbi:YfiR family protein [Thalassomonas haliotis]|uniref:YfiR family protein n=1 Tax=Thalassomonas haliotis TaxID=485448 RepID=A0ABY7VGY6_9GAMM|nr:YfiR family protein [Thalassomonas haliotis]WDE12711.1 YfiR family protein [Thalassomonas haliotis]